MLREKDPMWEHGVEEGPKIKCSFCDKGVTGGITRFKYHLSQLPHNNVKVCFRVPPNVRDLALNSIRDLQSKPRKRRTTTTATATNNDEINTNNNNNSAAAAKKLFATTNTNNGNNGNNLVSICGSSATCTNSAPLALTIAPHNQNLKAATNNQKKHDRDAVDLVLVRAMVMNNLPFRLLRSPEFQETVMAIANYGPGYKLPKYDNFKTKIIEGLKGQACEYVNEVKRSWAVTACTLIPCVWRDPQSSTGRMHVSVVASSPAGSVFLKSTRCCSSDNNAENLVADFVCQVVEEIGPNNVVQIVMDNDPNCVAAGAAVEQRYPNVFKTPCAARCVELMLEEFGKLPGILYALHGARKIVKFVYKYQIVLDLMRAHTHGRELRRPSSNRFVNQVLCLHSVMIQEENLKNMVRSPEWNALIRSSNSEEVKETTEILTSDVFWNSTKEGLCSMEPLMRVLRMVEDEGSRPTMGYLYEALHRSKEAIKTLHENNARKYTPLWDAIDTVWNNNLHCALHTVAAFLNPQLFYDGLVTMNSEVHVGMEKVIQKMALLDKQRLLEELTRYHARDNKIFTAVGVDLLRTAHPRIWWEMCGSEVPLLQSLAIRILSQPCSACAYHGNKTAFKSVQVPKRHNLEAKTLHDLAFVRMNLLMKKASAEKRKTDYVPIFVENIEAFKDDNDRPSGEDDQERDDIHALFYDEGDYEDDRCEGQEEEGDDNHEGADHCERDVVNTESLTTDPTFVVP